MLEFAFAMHEQIVGQIRRERLPIHGVVEPERLNLKPLPNLEEIGKRLAAYPTLHLLLSYDFHGVLVPTEDDETVDPVHAATFRERAAVLDGVYGKDRIHHVINTLAIERNLVHGMDVDLIRAGGITYEFRTGGLGYVDPEAVKTYLDVRERLLEEHGLERTDPFNPDNRTIIEFDKIPLPIYSRDSFTRYFEARLSPEQAALVKFSADYTKKRVSIRISTNKSAANERYIRSIGVNPADTICLHFGDRAPDMPYLPAVFSDYFLVAPESSESEVLNRASFITRLPAGELVNAALEQLVIHQPLLRKIY